MRVFGIQPDGGFREYVQTPFQVDHEEAVLEDWLESNADGILENGQLLIIGRQVATDLGGFIDLLGVDREGAVVIVELKRDRTPRDTLAQALEYASFAEQVDALELEGILQNYLKDESLSLAEHHRKYFGLGSDKAVAFNKDQRIVIVGQRVTQEIRQTSSFLRSKGLRVTCVEFTFFQSDSGTRLLSQEIVVGKEPLKPRHIASGSLPVVTEEQFLSSLDENGRVLFSRILRFAREKNLPLHWGRKGFSLNVDLDGEHVAICFVYPPDSVYKESVYTGIKGPGGMLSKTAVPENVADGLLSQAEATGLFRPAGHELKCTVDRKFSEEEISSVISWCEAVAQAIKKHGLKE